MKLVVGLGNPGRKYEITRHNIGFLALDALIDSARARGPSQKNKSEFFQGEFAGESVLFIKPQTFMNLSGESVAPFFNFYNCKPEDLIVIHDELDLPPFGLRIKQGGGTGGHNGLKSLDQHLGSENQNYFRIRLGIGHPAKLKLNEIPGIHPKMDPSDFVLGQFTEFEGEKLKEVFDSVLKVTELLIQGRAKEAMNQFHRKEKE